MAQGVNVCGKSNPRCSVGNIASETPSDRIPRTGVPWTLGDSSTRFALVGRYLALCLVHIKPPKQGLLQIDLFQSTLRKGTRKSTFVCIQSCFTHVYMFCGSALGEDDTRLLVLCLVFPSSRFNMDGLSTRGPFVSIRTRNRQIYRKCRVHTADVPNVLEEQTKIYKWYLLLYKPISYS